jgi:hypothetical protein
VIPYTVLNFSKFLINNVHPVWENNIESSANTDGFIFIVWLNLVIWVLKNLVNWLGLCLLLSACSMLKMLKLNMASTLFHPFLQRLFIGYYKIPFDMSTVKIRDNYNKVHQLVFSYSAIYPRIFRCLHTARTFLCCCNVRAYFVYTKKMLNRNDKGEEAWIVTSISFATQVLGIIRRMIGTALLLLLLLHSSSWHLAAMKLIQFTCTTVECSSTAAEYYCFSS